MTALANTVTARVRAGTAFERRRARPEQHSLH